MNKSNSTDKRLAVSHIVLRFPDVESKTKERPKHCPHCGDEILQRWGSIGKPVNDSRFGSVSVYRFRCSACLKTFRQYPLGVDRTDQTQRMQKLVVVCRLFGLNYREIADVFAILGLQISRMTAWRAAKESSKELELANGWHIVQPVNSDGDVVQDLERNGTVSVAVDLGKGQPVAIGYLVDGHPRSMFQKLIPLMERLGIEVTLSENQQSHRDN